MEVVHRRCCGLDIHKKTVVACVLIDEGEGKVHKRVRTFSTMTADLLALADWLGSLHIRGRSREYGDLLAPDLQCPGGALHRHAGESPAHQARARSQDRRQ